MCSPLLSRCEVIIPVIRYRVSSTHGQGLQRAKELRNRSLAQQQRNLRTRPREARDIQRQLLTQIQNSLETARSREDGVPLATDDQAPDLDDGQPLPNSAEEPLSEPVDAELLPISSEGVKIRNDVARARDKKIRKFTPDQWDERVAEQYQGFNRFYHRTKHVKQIERAIQTSLKELFALKQEGRPLDEAFQSRESALGREDLLATKFVRHEGDTFVLTRSVTANGIVKDLGAKAEADTESRDSKNIDINIVEEVSRDSTSAGGERGTQGSVDQSWRDVSLRDSHLKFAVLKRTSQLLGTRFPDPMIAQIDDVPTLLEALMKKPKPAKLIKELNSLGVTTGLNNVRLVDGKITRQQKELETGRLKAIKLEMDQLRLMTPKQRSFALGR